jgi:selenium-binding protein 1
MEKEEIMKRYTKVFPLVSLLVLAFISLPLVADDDDKEKNAEFVHGIVLKVDGKPYYLAGAPDGPTGEFDIPGHSWVQVSKNKIIGKHYNTGPFGAPQWWSSDAADGALLYTVTGVIDNWSMVKAAAYYNKGFNHYHELVSVEDGSLHPDKIVWLRHAATLHFTLDGGPAPDLAHEVMPGIDFLFPPNWQMPYNPIP